MLDKKLASADPLARELAGYVSSEVNRLNALVSRFLDFARPAQLDLHAEEITPIIERALKAARDRWPEARINVETAYASDLPAVLVDAALCEQVFTNVVINAYEAMGVEGGKLNVLVKATRGTRGDEKETRRGVVVELQDSGPGIPQNFGSKCSILSSPPRRPASAWDCQSYRKSSTTTAAGLKWRTAPVQGLAFGFFSRGRAGGADRSRIDLIAGPRFEEQTQ